MKTALIEKGEINIKLLLCGYNNVFQRKLISKLQKENHEIFIITGNSSMEEKKEKGIFQQYNFEFTSERVGKVLENISPDMVYIYGLAG